MLQKVAEEIIKKALPMYMAKNTRYLKEAQIDKSDDIVNLTAKFSINNCCYAFPDSGHFNAVEAIICLNQMVYVALLDGIDKKMFSLYTNVLPDDFSKQWQKVYILEFEKIKFKKLINSTSFCGKIRLKPIRKVRDKVYVDCSFGFGNNEDCDSFVGNVKGFIPLL